MEDFASSSSFPATTQSRKRTMNGDGDSPATELLTGVALSGRREGKGGNEDAGRRASRGKGRQDERINCS